MPSPTTLLLSNNSEIQELSRCCICMENFTKHRRAPICIPCGHTFCSLCVERLVHGKIIECSICRKVSVIGFDKCGRNISLIQLLEQLNLLNDDKEVVPDRQLLSDTISISDIPERELESLEPKTVCEFSLFYFKFLKRYLSAQLMASHMDDLRLNPISNDRVNQKFAVFLDSNEELNHMLEQCTTKFTETMNDFNSWQKCLKDSSLAEPQSSTQGLPRLDTYLIRDHTFALSANATLDFVMYSENGYNDHSFADDDDFTDPNPDDDYDLGSNDEESTEFIPGDWNRTSAIWHVQEVNNLANRNNNRRQNNVNRSNRPNRFITANSTNSEANMEIAAYLNLLQQLNDEGEEPEYSEEIFAPRNTVEPNNFRGNGRRGNRGNARGNTNNAWENRNGDGRAPQNAHNNQGGRNRQRQNFNGGRGWEFDDDGYHASYYRYNVHNTTPQRNRATRGYRTDYN